MTGHTCSTDSASFLAFPKTYLHLLSIVKRGYFPLGILYDYCLAIFYLRYSAPEAHRIKKILIGALLLLLFMRLMLLCISHSYVGRARWIHIGCLGCRGLCLSARGRYLIVVAIGRWGIYLELRGLLWIYLNLGVRMLIWTILNSWVGTRYIEATLCLLSVLSVLRRLVLLCHLSCTLLNCCLLLLILRLS